jgi:hypothetical protein
MGCTQLRTKVYMMAGNQLLLLWLNLQASSCHHTCTGAFNKTTGCVFPCLQDVADALPGNWNGTVKTFTILNVARSMHGDHMMKHLITLLILRSWSRLFPSSLFNFVYMCLIPMFLGRSVLRIWECWLEFHPLEAHSRATQTTSQQE